MLPLHDDNPTTLRPFITVGLIAVCVAVFLYQNSLSEREATLFVLTYGAIPAELFGHGSAPALWAMPHWLTPVTSMFLHGGWMHLIGNMLFLWVFGNNVEDAMGHGRFVVFYGLCGLVAVAAHAASDPGAVVPMIGASGAISGVLGAYVLLYPRARILVFAWVLVLRLRAVLVLGIWFVMQIMPALSGVDDGVAWWAHVGGFLVGMVLVLLLKRRDVRLFQGANRPRGSLEPPTITIRLPQRGRSRVPVSGTPPQKSSSPPRRGPWG